MAELCIAFGSICAPLCELFLMCCSTGGSGDTYSQILSIPQSDLVILYPQHRPRDVFLMTQKLIDDYAKKANGLLSYDNRLLDSIPPEDRIIILYSRTPLSNEDSGIQSLKTLMTGIQSTEARALLGGDVVSLNTFLSQGIRTPGQLRGLQNNSH
ncbi:hypothetical protein CPB86DRAFT_692265 [Serendipita vermifera]|nr:hypothetical protein CPB86DRAFT_692265 [Serendipita vermifera]